MDFAQSEPETQVADLAQQVLKERTSDKFAAELSAKGYAASAYAALGETSLLGTAISEAYGGMDLGFAALCALLDAVGRCPWPVPAYASLVLGAMPISRCGSDAQKARWLPEIASGRAIATGVYAGFSAAPAASGYVLTGRAECVPAAALAQVIVVAAEVPGAGSVLLLLEPGAAGLEIAAVSHTSEEPHGRIVASGVALTTDAVLAFPPDAQRVIDWTTDRAVAALCAVQAGTATAALALSAQHAKSREQFGQPIGAFQAVAQRIADSYIDLRALEMACQQAVFLLAAERPAARELAIAKIWCCEGGHRVLRAAMHLHAGLGFDRDCTIHRYFLRGRANEITMGGSAEWTARLGALLAHRAQNLRTA